MRVRQRAQLKSIELPYQLRRRLVCGKPKDCLETDTTLDPEVASARAKKAHHNLGTSLKQELTRMHARCSHRARRAKRRRIDKEVYKTLVQRPDQADRHLLQYPVTQNDDSQWSPTITINAGQHTHATAPPLCTHSQHRPLCVTEWKSEPTMQRMWTRRRKKNVATHMHDMCCVKPCCTQVTR